MRRYRGYPIYINYNRYTEAEKEAEYNKLYHDFYFKKPETPGRIGFDPNAGKLGNMLSPQGKKYFDEQAEARLKYGDATYDYMPDMLRNQAENEGRFRDEIKKQRATIEGDKYERNVARQLDIIRGTAIGNLVLDSISSSVKVWIVLDQVGVGVASTTPGAVSDRLGGGVRLHYEPDWFDPKMEYYTPDDVLFHELVHAYRSSKGQNHSKALAEYQTAEELLAVQMQNVYMAMRKKKRFYRSHSNPSLASRDDVYAGIAADAETLEAFNFFRYNEPITAKVAAMGSPFFNAWRDVDKVNAMAASDPRSMLLRSRLPLTF